MTLPSVEVIAQMTPMMRQYYELKAHSHDAILFFRMGDFYEIFGDDAEEVAPLLEIVLTSRERGDKQKIKFCGVPHHSAHGYWLKLLKLGYKVAIADQVEDASLAKGLVKRDIIKTMTPGCIDELEGLDGERPNYVMAAYEEPVKAVWAVALADISTGELRLGQLAHRSDLVKAVELHQPKELLIRRFCLSQCEADLGAYRSQTQLALTALPEAILRDDEGQRSLWQELFACTSPAAQPCGEVVGGGPLVAALMTHLRALQTTTAQFLSIKPLADPAHLQLDETAIRDLELFETARRRTAEGSLLRQINHTLSPMGARLLRWSLANPMLKAEAIAERHNAIATLQSGGEASLNELREALKGFPDVERLTTRAVAGSIRAHELARIREGLRKADALAALLERGAQALHNPLFSLVTAGLRQASAPRALLEEALCAEPTQLGEGDGVFSPGYDAVLDEKVALSKGGEEKVEAYCERLRAQSGIQSLKIKFHKTFGLVIEVTKTNLGRVPDSFIRRQTMVNCERFVTVELRELDESLASARDHAIAREGELYTKLVTQVAALQPALRAVATALAQFDLLQSFAWLALRHHYCKPQLNTQQRFYLEGCRHPVVEHYVGRHRFVANTITMDGKTKQLLITGPNMAGKSTVMRQAAIAAILNQAGGFVPAVAADLPIFDRIYTRVGACDDLSHGLSTFMVEMAEAAQILRHATSASLVILDEVGRGTSTEDGLAIASAILEHLALSTQSWTLFATHYHELVPLAANLPSVKIVQTEVKDGEAGISFTHRLIAGASGSSFGIEVAELAGIPPVVLKRAKDFLATNHARIYNAPVAVVQTEPARTEPVHPEPTPLFREDFASSSRNRQLLALSDRLERIKINRTTPLQALNILNELKSTLSETAERGLFQDRQS